MQYQLHELLPDPEALVQHLWPSLSRRGGYVRHEDYQHFFNFLRREAHKLGEASSQHVEGLFDGLSHHIDVFLPNVSRQKSDMAQALGFNHVGVATDTTPRSDSQAAVSLSQPVSRSLDVIARLWLTINVDTFPLEQSYPRKTAVAWAAEHTLIQAIESHFANQKAIAPTHPRKIPSFFKMTSLCGRGFSILWSSNIADHLEIAWDGNHGTITVYEHVVCLRNHLENHLDYPSSCRIPAELLGETLDTILLLFPPDDEETQKLLESQGKNFWKLGRCVRDRVLNADRFRYWRSGIDELLDQYEKAPRGWRQLLLDKDRRNVLEFSTFWTAIGVALLSIIGLVYGTVGAVYAVRAYDLSYKQYLLSQKQYMLDLVQVCVEREARERWPQICSEAT